MDCPLRSDTTTTNKANNGGDAKLWALENVSQSQRHAIARVASNRDEDRPKNLLTLAV